MSRRALHSWANLRFCRRSIRRALVSDPVSQYPSEADSVLYIPTPVRARTATRATRSWPNVEVMLDLLGSVLRETVFTLVVSEIFCDMESLYRSASFACCSIASSASSTAPSSSSSSYSSSSSSYSGSSCCGAVSGSGDGDKGIERRLLRGATGLGSGVTGSCMTGGARFWRRDVGRDDVAGSPSGPPEPETTRLTRGLRLERLGADDEGLEGGESSGPDWKTFVSSHPLASSSSN